MKGNVLLLIAASTLAIAGCNQAKPPAEVRHDVAEAQIDAQRDIAQTQAEVQGELADAQADVQRARTDADPEAIHDSVRDARDTAAEGDFKVAVARAEATHKIATEKCNLLSGEAQNDCKQRADNDLDTAKRAAETRRDCTG